MRIFLRKKARRGFYGAHGEGTASTNGGDFAGRGQERNATADLSRDPNARSVEALEETFGKDDIMVTMRDIWPLVPLKLIRWRIRPK